MQSSDLIDEIDPKTGKIICRFVKGKLLGKGGFAKCYEVTECETGKIFAAKIIEKKTLTKPKTQQKLKSEIKIHSGLRHQHIVKFEKFFEDHENVYIMLEVCSNQTLMELLRRKRRLTEPEAAYVMLQTLSGVKHMHDKNIIHRDLKLGNLFLTNKMEVKIGDFGLAAQLEFDGERKLTVCGTPNYIAPEILDGGKEGHSFEVDIWSLGVIMYTLLVGKPPFETNDVKTTYRKIRNISYSFPDSIEISPAAKNLIQRILQSCPESRPTLVDLQKDEWFRQQEIFKNAPYTLFPHGPERQLAQERQFKEQRERELAKLGRRSEPLINTNEIRREPLKPLNVIYDKSNSLGFTKCAPLTARGSTEDLTRKLSGEKLFEREGLASIRTLGNQKTYAPSVQTEFCTMQKESATVTPTVTATQQDDLDEDEKANLTHMHQNISICIQTKADKLSGNAFEVTPVSTLKPSVWVTEYSDFSAKYGLAYKLSSGNTGAAFNDGTKMIWDNLTGRVEYYSRNRERNELGEARLVEEKITCASVTEYPETLKKKITLITYFKNYFAKYKGKPVTYPVVTANQNSNENDQIPVDSNFVYVKQWMKHSHATVFRLSNKCFQVSFLDGTDILLSSEARMVTYTDQKGNSKTFALEMGKIPHKEVSDRLEYTQRILHEIMHKN